MKPLTTDHMDKIQRLRINRREFTQKSMAGAAGFLLSSGGAIANDAPDVRNILKTDTHVHFFNLSRFDYHWLKNAPEINREFTIEDFQAASKKSNIGKILFVESGAAAGLGIEEATWVSSLTERDSRIKGIIANLDISQRKIVSSDLQKLTNLKLLKGIRCGFPKNAHESDKFINGLNLLAAKHLSYDINVPYNQLSNATKLIRKCPRNTFVLDHMGNPDIKTGEMEIWKAGIKEISELPNVFCKVSGIITKSGKDWTTSLLEPYFMQVVESFGLERLMYGGDWPVVLLAGSYLSWSRTFEELTEGFSNNELLQIYNKNADRIYQL